MIAVLVFLSGFAVDWAWIFYMHWAGKKRALPAAFWSMVLVAVGCFAGTYSAVRWGPK